jgi:hypothetical protein
MKGYSDLSALLLTGEVSMETDLLGDPLVILATPGRGKRRDPKPWGYACPPGTGPAGETCGSCTHHVIKRMAKNYHKCELARAKWTGGGKSDIRVRAPACSRWAANDRGVAK